MRAAIYTRVSLDRDGTKASPETQQSEARQLCLAKGWEVCGVYSDRNASAFKRGAKRPEYERMLQDIDRGEIDMVVAYKLDRLTRGGMASVASLLTRLESAGAGLVTVHDNIDTSTELGRGMVGFLGSIARQESENISTRVSSAHTRAAAAGRMHSGGARQFGYERDGTIRAHEAEVVREVAKRVEAGESFRQIAIDLNSRGIPTSTGRAWRAETLSQMIRSPRLVGLRRHKEALLPGDWESILDRDTWDACIRQRAVSNRSVAAHLLTGRIYCGRCGGRLKTMGMRLKNGKLFPRYQCVRNPGSQNCGGLAIAKESLERCVVDRLFALLARDGLGPIDAAARHRSGLEEKIAEQEDSLVELSQDYYVHRRLTSAEFQAAREALVHLLEADKRRFALLEDTSVNVVRPGSINDLEEWWQALTLEQRRALIQATISRVDVYPATVRGGNRFDPSRVRIRWAYAFMYRVNEAHTYSPEELAEDEAEQRRVNEEMWDDPEHLAKVAQAQAEWLAEHPSGEPVVKLSVIPEIDSFGVRTET